MPKLDLTAPEAALLCEIAEAQLSDLRAEIRHTDNARYRDGLKDRESLLVHVVEQLGMAVARV